MFLLVVFPEKICYSRKELTPEYAALVRIRYFQVPEQIFCGSVKRETGVNPVRTRHRILRAKADNHWETGKGPERRINKSGELPFVVREPEVPCHEGLAVHMNRMRDGMYFQRVFTSW